MRIGAKNAQLFVHPLTSPPLLGGERGGREGTPIHEGTPFADFGDITDLQQPTCFVNHVVCNQLVLFQFRELVARDVASRILVDERYVDDAQRATSTADASANMILPFTLSPGHSMTRTSSGPTPSASMRELFPGWVQRLLTSRRHGCQHPHRPLSKSTQRSPTSESCRSVGDSSAPLSGGPLPLTQSENSSDSQRLLVAPRVGQAPPRGRPTARGSWPSPRQTPRLSGSLPPSAWPAARAQ